MILPGNKLRPCADVNGRRSRTLGVALAAILLTGGDARAADVDNAESLLTLIESARALKDSLFRHSPDSPILPEERPAFAGLLYFPVDPQFRLVGELHRYGRPRRIQFPSNDGTFVEVERFGRFVFDYRSESHWLEIVRNVEAGDLSIFFKDLTNGRETYAAGRYAKLRPVEGATGRYALDLNEAYSPYCAYNPTYVCPLPPPQNSLPYEIRAGERHEETSGPDLAR